MDGVGQGHDAHRSYRNKKSSCFKVVNAIEKAINIGIDPTISITISSKNVREFPEFMDWVASRDLGLCINFYRETDFAQDSKVLTLDDNLVIDSIREGYERYAQYFPLNKPLVSQLDLINLSFPHLYPCGTGSSSLAIGAQGEVNPCQMQAETILGTLSDADPFSYLKMDNVHFNPSVDEKEGCKQCIWRYVCAGGCPLLAYRVKNSHKLSSPYCSIYHNLIPDMILFEGRRLLAVAERSI